MVSHVSWWQVGKNVIANGEYQNGDLVDPHNCEIVGDGRLDLGEKLIPLDEEFFADGFHEAGYDFNPAHQAYDPDLGLISTIGKF